MEFTTAQTIHREAVFESRITPDTTPDRKLGAVLYRPTMVRATFEWTEDGWKRTRLHLAGPKVLKNGEPSKVGDAVERLWNDTAPTPVARWAEERLQQLVESDDELAARS
jgi:hypothetical protein